MRKLTLNVGLVALLIWPNVSSASPKAGVAPVNDIALYTMDCGLFYERDSDGYDDKGRYRGRSAVMSNPCWLVKHGSDYMMWNVGMQDINAVDNVWLTHAVFKGAENEGLVLTNQRTLANQLKQIKLDPKNVKFVAFCTMYGDHNGNVNLFTNATLLMDSGDVPVLADEKGLYELAKIYYGTDKYGMLPAFAVMRKMKRIEMEHGKPYDVFGDGTVVIYPAPSIYPNGRMLLVRLPKSGSILLTGDTWHLATDRKLRTIPRIMYGKPTTEEVKARLYATIDAIEKLAKDTGARVIIEHSIDDYFSFPHFPAALH